jgi:hypothetical protein
MIFREAEVVLLEAVVITEVALEIELAVVEAGQAQLTILSGNNQSQRNSTNSKNSRNLPSYQRK